MGTIRVVPSPVLPPPIDTIDAAYLRGFNSAYTYRSLGDDLPRDRMRTGSHTTLPLVRAMPTSDPDKGIR